MDTALLAEAFPAGEFLADELEAREWTQAEFAEIIGRPAQFVSELVSGKKEITRESASQIAAALGTSPKFWLNLQDTYHLWLQAQDPDATKRLDDVKLRAKLHELAPVSILKKRGYIRAETVAEQAEEVIQLFGMSSLSSPPPISFAARRSNGDEEVSLLQRAWVACIRYEASRMTVPKYNPEGFAQLARELTGMLRDPAALAGFQSLFAEVGVKLTYVESFPGGKLDGCSLMVRQTPVIGISGRGKRLDKVFFTILHEVAHVLLTHLDVSGEAILDDLTVSSKGIEKEADELAGALAIPMGLPKVPNRISVAWVTEQAEAMGVAPIVLIGRLQNLGHVPWSSTLTRNAPSGISHLQTWGSEQAQRRKDVTPAI